MNEEEFKKWQEQQHIKYIRNARLYQILALCASLAGLLGIIFIGNYINIFSLMVGVGTLCVLFYSSPAKQPKKVENFIGISSAVILLTYIIYTGMNYPSDCYIDWDGRSNPTVCD